jgi:hypothetical protein
MLLVASKQLGRSPDTLPGGAGKGPAPGGQTEVLGPLPAT